MYVPAGHIEQVLSRLVIDPSSHPVVSTSSVSAFSKSEGSKRFDRLCFCKFRLFEHDPKSLIICLILCNVTAVKVESFSI